MTAYVADLDIDIRSSELINGKKYKVCVVSFYFYSQHNDAR